MEMLNEHLIGKQETCVLEQRLRGGQDMVLQQEMRLYVPERLRYSLVEGLSMRPRIG